MARLGEQVGFVDRTGAFVIQPAFTDADSFEEGLARVRLGGTWGLRVENPYPDLGPPSTYFTEISGGEYGYIRHPQSIE
ncbi:MAG: WG repeat-containing protein [Cyanobacteria bacterium J06638_20]